MGVRGDSRRDLYSKALALCGLGALAGAGAVVDYWPVAVRFPAAPAPLVHDLGTVPPAPRMAEDAFAVLASLIDVTRDTRQPSRAPAAQAVSTLQPAVVGAPELRAPLPVSTAALFDIGTPIALEMLPAPVLVSARQEMPEPVIVPAGLVAPAQAPRLDNGFASAADGGDEPGLLASAFRKTGSSIVRTGVRTGSSLVDVVRVVGGAVRRAWPD